MTITSYFGLKPCCDCGRTGNYTINKNGYQFTVCADCIQNYTDDEKKWKEYKKKMTKEALKPIDVSKYKVTETGQVLKMTKDSLNKELAKKADTNHALVLQLAELEAQIEKMKCCYNCSKWNEGLLLCNDSTVRVTTYADYCCEDWEIKEK